MLFEDYLMLYKLKSVGIEVDDEGQEIRWQAQEALIRLERKIKNLIDDNIYEDENGDERTKINPHQMLAKLKTYGFKEGIIKCCLMHR